MAGGERLSAPIFAAALAAGGAAGGAARRHRGAGGRGALRRGLSRRRRQPAEARGAPGGFRGSALPVVTGFFGADAAGDVRLFGRGGSDTSATAIGAALGAERVEIWTDVDGVATADPRLRSGGRAPAAALLRRGRAPGPRRGEGAALEGGGAGPRRRRPDRRPQHLPSRSGRHLDRRRSDRAAGARGSAAEPLCYADLQSPCARRSDPSRRSSPLPCWASGRPPPPISRVVSSCSRRGSPRPTRRSPSMPRWWSSPPARPVPAPKPVTVDMVTVRKAFLPRILVVPVGSTVRFPNQDPILHNVFSVSGRNSFDLGLLGKGAGKSALFREAGIVRVFCNVHHGMFGYVFVVASPYWARVGADGTFRIAGVPAGRRQADGLERAQLSPPRTELTLPVARAARGSASRSPCRAFRRTRTSSGNRIPEGAMAERRRGLSLGTRIFLVTGLLAGAGARSGDHRHLLPRQPHRSRHRDGAHPGGQLGAVRFAAAALSAALAPDADPDRAIPSSRPTSCGRSTSATSSRCSTSSTSARPISATTSP